MKNNPGIGIVGGGIGGLTAALALLRKGQGVTVFEQASKLQEVGAGLQVSPNGVRILFDLGLGKEIRAACFEPEGKEIRLWKTGDTWKLFDLGTESQQRYGFPYITVHRNDLQRIADLAPHGARSRTVRVSWPFAAVNVCAQQAERWAFHVHAGFVPDGASKSAASNAASEGGPVGCPQARRVTGNVSMKKSDSTLQCRGVETNIDLRRLAGVAEAPRARIGGRVRIAPTARACIGTVAT